MKPLVSILIPAFNAQNWIADTIRSAARQTWSNKEIIVVDDGSTDRTVAIARQFESDTIRVAAQTNQGAAAARNTAFSLCRGDYIQWLDADDLLSRDKIASQLGVLGGSNNARILLSSAWGQFMYRPARARFRPTALWCDLSPADWLVRKMSQNIFMQTSTWLVSRELTEAAGPWNPGLAVDDDGEYFGRVLLQSDRIRFVPEAKVYYRISGPGSLSYIGLSDRKADSQWLSMQLQIGYLRSLENTGRVHSACLENLQSSLIYFYPERERILLEMQELASELGGTLRPVPLSWKYLWIERICGHAAAKRARFHLPQWRQLGERLWDQAGFHLARLRAPQE